jgi:biopolymer transport protein ExbB
VPRTARLSGVLLPALAFLLSSPALCEDGKTIQDTAASAQRDLDASLKELSDLRATIAAEKLPMTRRLTELEGRLVEVRKEAEDRGREFDSRNLDLTNLRSEIKALGEEKTYLGSLLDEYSRNLETRLHITELQRYRESIESARMAAEDPDVKPAEVLRRQADVVLASVDRLLEISGGTTFDGTAVGEGGAVKDVTFALVGPVAFYTARDGSSAGIAEQRLGSLEPNMVALGGPADTALVKDLVAAKAGRMPFDATLGNAQKIEATQESLIDHARKGGVVMVPILLLAAAAFLVAVLKWVQLTRVRNPSNRSLKSFLESLKAADMPAVREKVKRLPGPMGEMLRAGVEHLGETKDLVEEVMFERMLETRLKLQSFLPFVAVSAAAAPLLGLLGTVTGIINTFKLITVFGTGDAKTLSSGISEALITTEFGLIIAIPSLLFHAYLSRRARRLVNGMEKTAVGFLNRMPQSSAKTSSAPKADPTLSSDRAGSDAAAVVGARPAFAGAGPDATDH